jgi:hypothetical protein
MSIRSEINAIGPGAGTATRAAARILGCLLLLIRP